MNKLESYVKNNIGRLTNGKPVYTITVKQPWFDLIANGEKTAEGRLNNGLFAKLKEGDIIEWIHSNKKIKVLVSYITKYKSFLEMLESEGISNVLPVNYVQTAEEGVNKVYRQYYDESREKQFGVIAIGMIRMNII